MGQIVSVTVTTSGQAAFRRPAGQEKMASLLTIPVGFLSYIINQVIPPADLLQINAPKTITAKNKVAIETRN